MLKKKEKKETSYYKATRKPRKPRVNLNFPLLFMSHFEIAALLDT